MPTFTAVADTDQLTPAHAGIVVRMLAILGQGPASPSQSAQVKAMSYSDLHAVAETIARSIAGRVDSGTYVHNIYTLAMVQLRCAAGAPDTTSRGFHMDSAINELCAANMTASTAPASALAA